MARLIPALRTLTEIVAAADYLSRECASTFGETSAGEDGDNVIPELFQRNGLADSQRTALCDRTRRQLERSKVFLSLLGT